MASFNLTPGTWAQIVSSGGPKSQQIRVTHGIAAISIGVPDASASYQRLGTLSPPMVVPAGAEIQARADTPLAIITSGDW